MEQLLEKMQACRRQLELEDRLPAWERQLQERKAQISEMTENLKQKEQALEKLGNPGFLQRLSGKTGVQKERICTQLREITAARTAAQRDLQSLEQRILSGKREQLTLADSRTAYEAAKSAMVLTPALESQLMMAELSAFAPFAMETAAGVLTELEEAEPWLKQEQHRQQQLETLEAAANRLQDILSVLPEGIAPVGSFLREPRLFLGEGNVSDRLIQAQEQIRQVINQLRLLLGE